MAADIIKRFFIFFIHQARQYQLFSRSLLLAIKTSKRSLLVQPTLLAETLGKTRQCNTKLILRFGCM
jgi:hypothetical protein